MLKTSKINSQVDELQTQIELSESKLKALKVRQTIFERKIKKSQKGLKEKLDRLTYIVDTKDAKKGEEIKEDLREHIEKAALGILKDNIIAEEEGEHSLHLSRTKERLIKIKSNLAEKIGIRKLHEVCQIKEKIIKLEVDKEKVEKEINQEDKALRVILDSSSESEIEQKDNKSPADEEKTSKKRKNGYADCSQTKVIRIEVQKQKEVETEVMEVDCDEERKAKEVFAKTNSFLMAKGIFLNNRRMTIDKL